MTQEEKINEVLRIALELGGHDGEYHKAYAIDQIVNINSYKE